MNDLHQSLEPISARGWPPKVLHQLGDWRLHAASGFSGRANACWPFGQPDRPISEAIDAVERWYLERGLPAIFRPADVAETQPLRVALGDRGYAPRTETLVMAGPLSVGPAAGALVLGDFDEGFTHVFLSSAEDPGDAAERIETLSRIAAPRAFARIDIDGAPAAVGAAAVEGPWAGVFGMRTIAAHRRKGLARAIMGVLCSAAHEFGASRAYLQVEASNQAAIALYQGLGFETAYRYRYWDRR